MISGLGLPGSVGRQLAGTLGTQLVGLRGELARIALAAAITGTGFQGSERLVLAVLREAKGSLRARQVEELARVGKTSVNEALNQLEHRGLVRRIAVPSPTKTPAWAWEAV